MFQTTREEFDSLRFQIETSRKVDEPLQLQSKSVRTGGWGGTRYLPYAFTEQGVVMLSGLLNSEIAISMNIAIMRAFVEIPKILLQQSDLKMQLQEIKQRISEHDAPLNQLSYTMRWKTCWMKKPLNENGATG